MEAEAASQSSLTLTCTPCFLPCTRPALRQAFSAPDLSCTQSTLHNLFAAPSLLRIRSTLYPLFPAPSLPSTQSILHPAPVFPALGVSSTGSTLHQDHSAPCIILCQVQVLSTPPHLQKFTRCSAVADTWTMNKIGLIFLLAA